jgi:hypothetical protein
MVEEMTAAAHGQAGEIEQLGQLIARYQIRQTQDDPLRAELKKAAPHAFREATKTVASETPAPAYAKTEPVRRPTVRAVVNGPAPRRAPSGSADEGWREF